MSPVFSHGDLRLYLLRLLDEAPRHGYDIIQQLGERTAGTYSPSAGTIYPRLAKLESEGLVTKRSDGRKTVYEITDAGRAEVQARQADLDEIDAGLADSVRLIADGVRQSVREAMRTLKADLAAAGGANAAEPQRAKHAASAPNADGPEAAGKAASRAEMGRADAAVDAFRAGVRTQLRTHLARGGTVSPAAVDRLQAALEAASASLELALRG